MSEMMSAQEIAEQIMETCINNYGDGGHQFLVAKEEKIIAAAIRQACAEAERAATQKALSDASVLCINRITLNSVKANKYVSGSPEFYAFGNRSDEAEECAAAIEQLAHAARAQEQGQ